MLLAGDQTSRTIFSTSHLLRAVFSHTIWGAQPFKIEKAEELPYFSWWMRDLDGHSPMCFWLVALGRLEGSRPAWERLGNQCTVKADVSSWISGAILQSPRAALPFPAPPSPIQSPLSWHVGKSMPQGIRKAIELPLPATRWHLILIELMKVIHRFAEAWKRSNVMSLMISSSFSSLS